MNLEFHITESFDKDMNSLPVETQDKIKAHINFVSGSLLNGKTAFRESASVPYIFNLKNGLDSSLYLVKVDDNKKMIAAVDEDPIFDKIFLTMFRLVDAGEAEKAYKEVGEQLYKSNGIL